MPRRKNLMPDPGSMLEQLNALAAHAKRKGVPREHVVKREASKVRNRKARQKAVADRWHAERAARFKARKGVLGTTWADRCVKAMAPGEWYADRDLQNAMGAAEDQPVQVAALTEELIHKRRNPEWGGQNRYGEMQAPKWLYQLTPKGEARRALCLLLE